MKKSLLDAEVIDNLMSKQVLTDVKAQLLEVICLLLQDSIYTKDDAAWALLQIIPLIELEEGPHKIEQLCRELKKL
ncbi:MULTISPECIES: hypothetical protein [Gracilibacillus]|uniref:hypothetical protein n=1 Tax=Gracilibacillus TaxID=74385 RepID=UPI00082440E6|nr:MULTISPECIES: hypothetical protein [Gracilibacillus]